MRSFVPSKVLRRSVQGAAFLVISGVVAGCSSNTGRFTDSFYTGATPNQQAVINKQGSYQEMPPYAGSVQSADLAPVQSAVYNAPQSQPVYNAQAQQMGTPPQNLGTLPANNSSYPVAQTTARAATNGSYVVQSGDTLYSVSRKTGVNVTAIQQANGLSNGAIRVGQSLVIPGGSHATTQVAAATTVAPKVEKVSASQTAGTLKAPEQKAEVIAPKVENTVVKQPETAAPAVASKADSVQSATNVAVVAPQATGISQLRWPARGKILSSYGQKEGTTTNDGVDIMLPEGSSVKAAENGVVIYAGDGLKEFGQTVLIKHENNLVTVYGHNSKITVKRGQQVKRGDEIAKSGMSGNAATPRLHFEVRKNSAPVNPVKFLEN